LQDLGLKSNHFAMHDDALLFMNDPAVQADTEGSENEARKTKTSCLIRVGAAWRSGWRISLFGQCLVEGGLQSVVQEASLS
jgi:hypothetical protein